MAEILRQARNERRFPGDGDCDLPGLLRCLPANIPLSLEIPTLQLLEQGVSGWTGRRWRWIKPGNCWRGCKRCCALSRAAHPHVYADL
jgi:hypothetical protein